MMGTLPDQLEDVLGYRFAKPEYLVEALIHSSISKNHVHRLASNERMEFLGDRVLGLVVAHMLFERYAHEDEGALARRHAELVRKETLARVADAIGLARHIRMSRGEEDAGGRSNPALLADACEAVIAAMFMDGGLAAAGPFIRGHWSALADEDLTPPKDAKTALQEWAQARSLPLPAYREIGREGPAHAPIFCIEVAVQGHPGESASAPSKRGAEQMAARTLIDRLEEAQSE